MKMPGMRSMTSMSRLGGRTPSTPEERAAAAREYYAQNKERTHERIMSWRGRNPHKRSAHLAVKRALYAGTLVKPDHCAGDTVYNLPCARANPDAHHDDYEKPLDVLWLCRKHHKLRHIHLTKLGINPD